MLKDNFSIYYRIFKNTVRFHYIAITYSKISILAHLYTSYTLLYHNVLRRIDSYCL